MTWQVVNDDCLHALRGMASGVARLVFADPPYNIGVAYGDHYNDDRPLPEFLDWCESWMRESARILTPDGSLWVLVNHELGFRLFAIGVDRIGLSLRQTIIWRETFGVNCVRKFNRTSRPLLHFVKDPLHFVFNANAPEIRRKSDRQTKYNDKRANPDGKLLDDVWDIRRVCGTFKARVQGFPTQLDVELPRRIIACASDPSDLVVDPFSGSATTGVACIEMGRRFLGIELSEKYASMSRERLRPREVGTLSEKCNYDHAPL